MPSPEKQMLIRFSDIKVTKLDLKFSGPTKDEEYNVFIDFEPVFYKEESKIRDFALSFDLRISSPDNASSIELKALSYFNTSEPITEDFKTSDWVKINAPAIAFPFLRAYISSITIQSGVNPIILPAFNFTRLKDRGKESIGG
jgi:preprotein translocase subunit SecB